MEPDPESPPSYEETEALLQTYRERRRQEIEQQERCYTIGCYALFAFCTVIGMGTFIMIVAQKL